MKQATSVRMEKRAEPMPSGSNDSRLKLGSPFKDGIVPLILALARNSQALYGRK